MLEASIALTWTSSMAVSFLLGYLFGARRRPPPGNGDGAEEERGSIAAL